MKNSLHSYLLAYFSKRPLFLSLIRAKELELYDRYMEAKHPILDVGCGDGYFAKILFAQSQKFVDVGLDVKGSRMEEARRFTLYKKLVYYDGKTIRFKAHSFQTIVSNCVLEHVSDLDDVIKEMYRVLKPKGRAYLTIMAKPWEDHLFGSMFLGHSYVSYMQKKQQHVNLLSETQWKQAFKRAGFRIGKCIGYLSPKTCRFIDLAHYLSIPSLISYVLFKQWVLFPALVQCYPISWLSRLIEPDVNIKEAGALFFVLKK